MRFGIISRIKKKTDCEKGLKIMFEIIFHEFLTEIELQVGFIRIVD
jgi:hypothetical protein